MKKLFAILVAAMGLSMIAVDTEAASRLGGGRSVGKQRDMTQQAQPKAPAQKQQQTTTPQQQPSGASKWLGPLAGLALGAGLAALFLNNGMAGILSGLLLIGLLAAAVYFVFRAVRARSSPQALRYAGASAGAAPAPAPVQSLAGGGSAAAGSVAEMSRWPAGFNADEFARQAKLNFVRMQDANDRADLAAMSEFLTPELYQEVEADVRGRGAAAQKTEVVTLQSEVLDVATEGGLYVVTVRFSGLIREGAGREPEEFNELWHLEKPVTGSSGWLVSGIQQA
jgi:predicted lipid-binding transport protein (Tim44 family)